MLGKKPIVHILAFFNSLIPLEERVSIKIPEFYLRHFKNLPENLSVYEYLVLSNAICHKFAEDKHQCTHFSSSTLLTYRILVKLNQRVNLLNKVRLAHGTREGIGHEWLEFKQGDSFKDFDNTSGGSHKKIPNKYGTTLTTGMCYYPNFRNLF